MADETAEKPAERAKPDAPQTYTVERLTDESHAFLGVPSHVAVGALRGAKKKNMTLAEAKKAIEEWLKTPAAGQEEEEEEVEP